MFERTSKDGFDPGQMAKDETIKDKKFFLLFPSYNFSNKDGQLAQYKSKSMGGLLEENYADFAGWTVSQLCIMGISSMGTNLGVPSSGAGGSTALGYLQFTGEG